MCNMTWEHTKMKELLLRSLHIVNFRAFRDLRINELGRVNLFVGRNNIGKTSLLEAIWLYARRGSVNVLRDLLDARDESRLPLNSDEEVDGVNAPLRYLFYGRPQLNLPGVMFSVGPEHDYNRVLTLTLQGYRLEQSNDGIGQRRVNLSPEEFVSTDDGLLGVAVRLGNEPSVIRQLNNIFPRRINTFSSAPDEVDAIFIPSIGPSRSQIAAWRDRSVLEGKKQHLLRALTLIDPDVEDVDLVSSTYQDPRTRVADRIPVVKIKGVNEFVPLRSLGDGMTRLFALALGLVNAQNGVLLIDEIESGIHYAVQPDMWQLVINLAAELNVQVFATTHSKDCVEAFGAAASDHPEEGVLVRLGRKNNNIIATTFDEEELASFTAQEIEIR